MNHLSLLAKWRAVKYDGVKGALPDWVPEHDRIHFAEIQEELSKGVSSGEIAYADVIRSVHNYSTGIGIYRVWAGMSRETHLYFLGNLLRAIKAEKDKPGLYKATTGTTEGGRSGGLRIPVARLFEE